MSTQRGGGGSGVPAANSISNTQIASNAAIDATKIADGSVTSTEFQYIGGLTSDVQAQINAISAGTTTSVKRVQLGGDFTISSVYTTYADVTAMSVSITTTVVNEIVIITFQGTTFSASSATSTYMAIKVGAGSDEKMQLVTAPGAGQAINVGFTSSRVFATPGTYTVQLRAARDNANFTLDSGTYSACVFTCFMTGKA